MKKLLLTAAALLCCSASMLAVPAYPGTITRHLPDRSTIEIKLAGDENFHYTTLTDGTLVKQNADGYFYYANVTDQGIECTRYKVGAKLPSHVKAAKADSKPISEKLQEIRQKALEKRYKGMMRAKAPKKSISEDRGLVILVNFADSAFTIDRQVFYDALNKPGYTGEASTGSAVDYFEDSSYGKYLPTFDVFGPYTLSQNMSYYGGNDYYGSDRKPGDMIVEACKLASADGHDMSVYDYDGDGKIDNVYVYYAGEGEASGGGEETVWPHRWVVSPSQGNFSGSTEDTKVDGVYVYDYACSNELMSSYKEKIGSAFDGVGTFIHEFSHVFGLPDLYDPRYGSHMTLDIYDVMDGAPYLNYGRTPVSYSAYERMFMGWMSPKQIFPTFAGDYFDLPTLESGEAYLLTPDGSKFDFDDTNTYKDKEYYLIENKSGERWDKYADYNSRSDNYSNVGDKGLLITHIKYKWAKWEFNSVNSDPNNMGVSYVYNDNQIKKEIVTIDGKQYLQYSDYYPMMPGKLNVTSVSFGNYDVSEIARDDKSGNIRFKISDKTAPNNGGIDDLESMETPIAIGGYGEIRIKGNAEAMTVATTSGATIYNGRPATITAAPGIYIVTLRTANSATTHKVAVR